MSGLELAWLTDALLAFVREYGYLALFVFIVLETAWIIHFVPSEIIIPAAAVFLVTDPATFALFVGLMTVGAVAGSLLAYYLFGVNGEQFLRRYGDLLRVPESEIDRSQRWFRRWGEGMMFWGRVVPVLRTPISIPAGYARMDLTRFTLYSTGGWLIYNTVLVWLVYSGSDGKAPIDVFLAPLAAWTDTYVALARAEPVLAALPVALAAAAGVAGWYYRHHVTRALS